MISKKKAAIGLAIAALISFQLSEISVPEKFDGALLYKFIFTYIKIAGSLVNI